MNEQEKLAAFKALQYQLDVCDMSVEWTHNHIQELKSTPYPKGVREQVIYDKQLKTLSGKLDVEQRLHEKLAARFKVLSQD